MDNARTSHRESIFQPLPTIVALGAGLLTLGFVLFLLSVLSGLQLGNTLLRPSPFIPYEAIWPGQMFSNLVEYAHRSPDIQMNCTSDMSPLSSESYRSVAVSVIPANAETLGDKVLCTFQPGSGLFRWVTVRVQGGRIQQVELISDVLPEDVLLLYWGMPDSISRQGSDQRLNLFWERSSYSAMATVIETSSIVRIVTLTANVAV